MPNKISYWQWPFITFGLAKLHIIIEPDADIFLRELCRNADEIELVCCTIIS